MEKLWTSYASISKCSTEEFCLQIYCKKWFSDRTFYITIADADIGSIKYLHTLFFNYLDHILVNLEQNRMVRTLQAIELFDKKWLIIFAKGLTQFRMPFLCLKKKICHSINLKTIIFQCSKGLW